MSKQLVILAVLSAGLTGCKHALPYAPTPDWTSAPAGQATGLALVDLDGDGFKDLVVSSGNDINAQHVRVFLNDKRGGFPQEPDWISRDKSYNGNIAVGDIDKNGWPDVAVTVALGDDGSVGRGYVKVYFNRQGRLEDTPGYVSEHGIGASGIALGDADGDGDLDIAVGVTVVGLQPGHPARIYFNDGGTLSPAPGWEASDSTMGFGVQFADLNDDGLLDLAVAAPRARIYDAHQESSGALRLAMDAPAWISADASSGASYLDTGPIGDSRRQGLLVSYNNCEFGGSPQASRFTAYHPWQGPKPIWKPDVGGCGSGVLLVDLDQDGWLDLIGGRWAFDMGKGIPLGAPLMIYRGTARAFDSPPAYSSSTLLTAEMVAVADLRNRALHPAEETFSITQPRSVVTLSRQLIERFDGVERNGAVLGPADYTYAVGRNWLSFARRLEPGERIRVRYTYSDSLDIAAANFGQLPAEGNAMLFYRR